MLQGSPAWQRTAAFGSESRRERVERGSVIDPVALAWAAVIMKLILCVRSARAHVFV